MSEEIELSEIQATHHYSKEETTDDTSKLSAEDEMLIRVHKGNAVIVPNHIWRGNTFCFFYQDDYPLLTIGPHCNSYTHQ